MMHFKESEKKNHQTGKQTSKRDKQSSQSVEPTPQTNKSTPQTNDPTPQSVPQTASSLSLREEQRLQRKVTRLSILLVVTVFIIKAAVSFFTQSLSFLVELSDSFIDLVAVSITFIALKESSKEPDFDHMFGHEKINSFAALLQSFLIIGLYGGILYVSVKNWILGTLPESSNTLWGVVALVLTIGLVFAVSQIIIDIGKKSKNQLILAQGTNFRGDFYRNITVIITLTVTYFNIKHIDAIVAIFFSLKSLYEGFQILRQSYKELVDTNPIPPEKVKKLQQRLENLPGVQKIQDLKIRTAGNKLDLSLCINVKGKQRAFQIDLMTQRMHKIVSLEFPDYHVNTYFCTKSPKLHPHLTDSQWISNIIRKSVDFYPEISNIHNIAIDQFQKEFLIRFHIDLPGNLKLSEGHQIISQFERDLQDIIYQTLSSDINLRIISHLEPTHDLDRIHTHPVLQTDRPDNFQPENFSKIHGDNQHELPIEDSELKSARNKIKDIVLSHPEVKTIHDIRLLREPEGWFISFMIHLKEDLTVFQAHMLNEQIEQQLFKEFPLLQDCTIHTEPMDD